MVAQAPTLSPQCAALARAFDRAKAERLIAFQVSPTAWECKSYTLTVTGPRPQDLACSCIAGTRGLTCKHVATVAFARKYGLHPIRPVAAPAVFQPIASTVIADRDPLWDAFN